MENSEITKWCNKIKLDICWICKNRIGTNHDDLPQCKFPRNSIQVKYNPSRFPGIVKECSSFELKK